MQYIYIYIYNLDVEVELALVDEELDHVVVAPEGRLVQRRPDYDYIINSMII